MVNYQLLHHMGDPCTLILKCNCMLNLSSRLILTYIFRTEIETYKELEPATRVLIMKALCDIRVEVLYLY